MLAVHLGLPRQSEILIIIFLGICFLSLDFSLFHLRSSLEEIWNTELNLERTKYLETPLKYITTGVLLARTLTLHAFLAFYVVMLWPAIFEEKPSLMLPWLLLGIIRCLILNIITFVVGTYICHKERGFSPICFEYILSQFIEHGPSIYAWMAILNFYRDLVYEDETPQSSRDSLLSNEHHDMRLSSSHEQNSHKKRSRSLSRLNQDYLYSNKLKYLPGDPSIEKLIAQLKNELINEKPIIRDRSKSFDGSFTIDDNLDDKEEAIGESLTILEKSLIFLAIPNSYVNTAKEQKKRYDNIMQDISIKDVKDLLNESLTRSTSRINKRIKSIQSHSDTEIQKPKKCYCVRTKMQEENSQQALLIEQEIANISLDLNTLDKFKSHQSEKKVLEHKMLTCDTKLV
ncbi:uncharacterized protein LOC126737147 isoform X2 [Anthonomus grandis grandis]|uniref:uncharacterized protein LOC126737147 isoform X2 n=1 Tax=Anthonomus grandis grandis TaxID=2921223 RepID=UPI002165ADF5|nr:uncharacterized protein LOC126737147 isoform X2 [Anthonomus grandis grandis]